MAQAQRLRHLNFYLYFQNIKLDGGNRTFSGVYISTGMCHLWESRGGKGLDKISPEDMSDHNNANWLALLPRTK